jgi:hypothetical protein
LTFYTLRETKCLQNTKKQQTKLSLRILVVSSPVSIQEGV